MAEIIGTLGDDIINGGDGVSDRILGGAGDDTIYGGNGSSYYSGRTWYTDSNDIIYGGDGNDIIYGGNDLNGTGGWSNDVIYGGDGNDTISGGTGIDIMSGGAGNDIIDLGGSDDDVAMGDAGDDIFNAIGAGDKVYGGLGNDIFVISNSFNFNYNQELEDGNTNKFQIYEYNDEGVDTLDITASLFTSPQYLDGKHYYNFVINMSTDFENIENLIIREVWSKIDVLGSDSDNQISGDVFYEHDSVFDGGIGNDTLTGGDLRQTLIGGAGNDALDGGLDDDTMIGGVGDDTYYVDSLNDIVTETNNEGNDTVIWQENTVTEFTIGTDISNIENFNALNSTSVINIFGDSNANIITGNSNNNVINGGAGVDTMIGGVGDDTYYVDSLDDIVTETNNEGNDTVYIENEQIQQIDLIGKFDNVENVIFNNSDISDYILNGRVGSTGQDSIIGNEFSNTMLGKEGSDFIVGGRGNDEIYGGADNDRIYGGLDNDILYGDEGNDRILGEYGNDIIFGGLGDDVILGNSGGDRLYGDEGNDRIYAGSANDLVRAGDGNDIIFGGTGNDYIFGDDGGDRIYGESGNDRIFAGALHDLVRAGDGNDIIDGGTGNDHLFGGAGSDTFVFDVNSGTDTIHDFEDGSDQIDISSLLASLGYSGSSAVADGYINFVDNGGNVEIYADSTGTGQFDTHFATLNGVNSSILSDADFIMA